VNIIRFSITPHFEGNHLRLRLNDFPDEPIYSLLFQDERLVLEELPEKWELIRNKTLVFAVNV
jgi:hypothetical protein